MSGAWGERTSNKYLTEHCGLLKKLKPGDLVLADRGFTIQESLVFIKQNLAVPAFSRGKTQLDPTDIEKTRGIANVMIHVEHVTGLLRQKYSILQSVLPVDYLMYQSDSGCPMVDRMIRVCSALTNISPPIVPFIIGCRNKT